MLYLYALNRLDDLDIWLQIQSDSPNPHCWQGVTAAALGLTEADPAATLPTAFAPIAQLAQALQPHPAALVFQFTLPCDAGADRDTVLAAQTLGATAAMELVEAECSFSSRGHGITRTGTLLYIMAANPLEGLISATVCG